MLNHQFEEPLLANKILDSRILPLWIYLKDAPLKRITETEENIATQLPSQKAREFRHSRGYARKAISELFNIDTLKVPLAAAPGQAPNLKKGHGYISISHCSDALLIAFVIFFILTSSGFFTPIT